MIGFSIMMWFAAVLFLGVSYSLLKGNISVIHGNVFDKTSDKVGYAKALGRPLLFMSCGFLLCGIVAFVVKGNMAIVYSVVCLIIIIAVDAMWFVLVQKRFR